MSGKVPVQSAKKAFEILELLAKRGRSTLSEIQQVMDMPQSTAHDYLTTLVDLQYVVKEGNQYRASTWCLRIGIGIRDDMQLFQLAKPEIDSLAERTDEHVSLMIEEHGLGVLLYISKGDLALDFGVVEGHRMALPTNAPGKAILAHMPDSKVERVLDEHGMPKITEATITDRNALYEQVETIRERGFSLDLGERVEGVRAVSVPITTQNHIHGAITVSGTTNRMTEERFTEDLPNLLFQAADVIEVQYTLGRGRQ